MKRKKTGYKDFSQDMQALLDLAYQTRFLSEARLGAITDEINRMIAIEERANKTFEKSLKGTGSNCDLMVSVLGYDPAIVEGE